MRKNDGHEHDKPDTTRKKFTPSECAPFDGWYSRLENLGALRALGRHWLTRLKANRRVSPDRAGLRAAGARAIAATGTGAHLEGYGLIEVFRIEATAGTTEYWATSNLRTGELGRLRLADASWRTEECRRGSKHVTNVGRCQCRTATAPRNHIGVGVTRPPGGRAVVLPNRRQPADGEMADRPRRRARLPSRTAISPCKRHYCVTPKNLGVILYAFRIDT